MPIARCLAAAAGHVSALTDAGHTAAFVRTIVTLLRAPLAMVCVVLFALSSTGVAYVGADAAESLCECGSSAHERNGRSTDLGAVIVEANALGHLLEVLFLDAGGGAMFTFYRTTLTCFDALGKLLVTHGDSLRNLGAGIYRRFT